MIHVFLIYSGIVARMLPRIIHHQQLDPENIIVLTDRSQTNASIPAGLRIESTGFLPLRNRWRSLAHDWSCILKNSNRISHLTNGRKFTAYLPSPSDATGQQILWHPLCQNYWLVEEGLGSYCQPGVSPVQTQSFTRFQKLQLGVRIRGLGRITPTLTDYPHWKQKYAGAFASNAKTFPAFPPRVINLDQALYQAVPSEFNRLVIFDDFSIFNARLQSVYLDVIQQVVAAEHQAGDRWAYKLHPRCAAWPDLLKAAEQIFAKALPTDAPRQALTPDTCAEDIGIHPAVTTYGYMSSCLFYIHQCGGNVVSFRNIVETREPEFQNFWKRFFPPVLDPLVGGYTQLSIPNDQDSLSR